MILNATVQHRVKHYDKLLLRELEFIKREYEQNLINYKNLENSIRRETNQISNINNKKKIRSKFDEIQQEINIKSNEDKNDLLKTNNLNDKSDLSILSINDNNQYKINELIINNKSSKYKRKCTKRERLPPIIKSIKTNREEKKLENNFDWLNNVKQLNKDNDLDSSFINENYSNNILIDSTPIEKQIQSFIKSLPKYTGIQKGFDNFSFSSLYSNRLPVIMK